MSRAWITEGGAVREVPLEDAVRQAAEGKCGAWIDLECVDEATATRLLAPLKIHPLVLQDMVMEINRPKVDNYGDYIYLVLHSARWDEERPSLHELDMVLGMNYLVTYHDHPTRSITAATETLPRRPDLLLAGASHLLHYILDVLVDNYLPIADRIAQEIDEFEDRVFDPAKPPDQLRIIRLKRGMSAVRRIVGPQRDTVLALTRDEFKPIPPDMRPYLRDVYDRLARVNDLLDSFRDEIGTVLELHLTMVSNRLNEVIKRLTVIATVGIPLTVVTSYYGMNFEFAEYHIRHAHLFITGLLLASAVGTLWYLKKRHWW